MWKHLLFKLMTSSMSLPNSSAFKARKFSMLLGMYVCTRVSLFFPLYFEGRGCCYATCCLSPFENTSRDYGSEQAIYQVVNGVGWFNKAKRLI